MRCGWRRRAGCGAEIDLDALPLSRAFIAERGGDLDARLFAATGGDDYALLAALAPDDGPVKAFFTFRDQHCPRRISRRRRRLFALVSGGRPVPLPERLV